MAVIMSDRGELSAADRLLAPVVSSTIRALDLLEQDKATAGLAAMYAREIDSAKAAEGRADAVLRKVTADSDLFDEVKALRVKLAARAALSDYGPKLAAVLESLGATPRARSAMARLGAARSAGPLARLRQAHGA